MSAQDKDLLSDYLRRRHSVSKLVVHLIFCTKYRRKIFDGLMIEQLRYAFERSCEKQQCELIEMDGEVDHVHLIVSYPPKLPISVMVNNLKSVSSRLLRQQNAHLIRLSEKGALWSRSYFAASAGGVTVQQLQRYVENQNTPD